MASSVHDSDRHAAVAAEAVAFVEVATARGAEAVTPGWGMIERPGLGTCALIAGLCAMGGGEGEEELLDDAADDEHGHQDGKQDEDERRARFDGKAHHPQEDDDEHSGSESTEGSVDTKWVESGHGLVLGAGIVPAGMMRTGGWWSWSRTDSVPRPAVFRPSCLWAGRGRSTTRRRRRVVAPSRRLVALDLGVGESSKSVLATCPPFLSAISAEDARCFGLRGGVSGPRTRRNDQITACSALMLYNIALMEGSIALMLDNIAPMLGSIALMGGSIALLQASSAVMEYTMTLLLPSSAVMVASIAGLQSNRAVMQPFCNRVPGGGGCGMVGVV